MNAESTTHALPREKLTLGLLLFSALSALGGGIALVVAREGSDALPPLSVLKFTPFESFLLPGLVLIVFVGGTSVAAALAVWRRLSIAIDLALLAGGVLTFWIASETAMLREVHGLQIAYGALGLAILALGVRAGLRSGEARHRWVILVTAAETVGYLLPSTVGVLAHRAEASVGMLSVNVIAAGLGEGACLGLGQAWAMPLAVNRARYALHTSLAAGLVWSASMLAIWLFSNDAVGGGAKMAAGALFAVCALSAIGTMQWLLLRRHAEKAGRWIAWTALAWTLALPWSFLPGIVVDEWTPLAAHLVLWGAGGALMAYVVALVTWLGMRGLVRRRIAVGNF